MCSAKTRETGSGEETLERGQVVDIINSVIEKVQTSNSISKSALFRELNTLRDVIEATRREISSARPGDIQAKHIPCATDELDAIVDATEEATGAIMDSCEAIQSRTGKMDAETSAAVETAVLRIFEACSFQDITGQRISKVVKTLKQIEEKVSAILGVMESRVPGIGASAETPAPEEKTGLLNGPQLPDRAASQIDIDRILAEFGK